MAKKTKKKVDEETKEFIPSRRGCQCKECNRGYEDKRKKTYPPSRGMSYGECND